MSPLATDALTLGAAARMLRDAVKDRSYRSTPLGLDVARYYRWKKNEWGAAPDTLRDYEAILRNLCVYFADLEISDFSPPVGTERLRECWDHHWGDRTPRTRSKVRSVFVDFFDWAVRERGLVGNPARALTAPKKHDVEIEVFSPAFMERLLTSQNYLADELGCILIMKYGLRRGGIANIQVRNFDFERALLTVFTKGSRIYPIPVVEESFWIKLQLLILEQQLKPNDYLIYKRDTRRHVVPLEEAEEVLELGNGDRRGYAWQMRRYHSQKPTGKLVHMWWYRCLERAGLVAKGETSGANMHRGRHTAITDLLRSSGNLVLAQKLAGHADIATTSRYTHMNTADLAEALRERNG